MTRQFQYEAVTRTNRGHQVGLILGENDNVFPPTQIREALESVEGYQPDNPTIIVLPGVHHSTPNSKIGRSQLMEGVRFLAEAA